MKALVSLAGLLIISSPGFAQSPAKPVKSHALTKCEADLKQSADTTQQLSGLLAKMTDDRDKLAAENKEIGAKNAELAKNNDDIKVAARELLTSDAVVYPAASKLWNDHNDLIQKYNSLLAVAQSQQTQLQTLTSRQQRFNNALAVYSLMPKYQAPQQFNLQVSNCNQLPALCVH